MKTKKYISTLAVLLCLFSLQAGVTAHYSLDATGFTNEILIKQRIGLPESAEYESVDEMKEKDLAYKQTLDNMRIFKAVEIVYTESSADSFDVLFNLTSANTFVAMPYPKYDSNTGLTLKMRVLDNNFLGNLGNLDFTAIAEQETKGVDSNFTDFSNTNFDIDVTLSSKIGSLYVSAAVDSNIYLRDYKIVDLSSSSPSYLDASLSISGFKLGKLSMSNSLSADFNFKNLKDAALGYSTNLGGFKFGNVGMSLSAMVRTTKVDLENMEFGVSSGFSGLKFGAYPMSFNPYVYAQVLDSKAEKIVPSRAGFSSGMSVGKHYFSTSFNNYWLGDTFDERTYDYPNWMLTASGSYALAKWITPSASVSVLKYIDSPWANQAYKTDFINFITLSESLGLRFGPVPVSLSQSNTFYFETEKVYQSIALGASYGLGAINYVRDDFRQGFKFSVSANAQRYFNTDWKDKIDGVEGNHVRGHLELTWFPIATQHFNPNIRVIASASDKRLVDIYDYDDGTDADGYGYGLFYGSETYLGDYLRGIRTYDEKALAVSDYDAVAMVNVNMMLRSENLGSFMRFYFNPFFDAAALYDFEKQDLKYFAGAGLELITVLSSYPAYPIRASVGFDLENLKKKISNVVNNTEETINGSFFEIFIGLHHFF